MVMVSVKMLVLIFIMGDEMLQWDGPLQVLVPFDFHQDLGLRDEERGVVVRSAGRVP